MEEQEQIILSRCNDRNTESIKLNGLTCRAKVVQVHDGDTLKIVILYRGIPTKFSCRMRGYDSPELSQAENDDSWKATNALFTAATGIPLEEKRYSQKELCEKMQGNNKIVSCSFFGKDKYGREIIEILDDAGTGTVNAALMQHVFNIEYNGRGKRPVHT
jgi:endonuclease YncB( thermonuclease family)